MIVYVLFACALISTLWWAGTYKEPNYTVALATVLGLDLATDIGCRPALDPLRRGQCNELGTGVLHLPCAH